MLVALALALTAPAPTLVQFRIRSHYGEVEDQRLGRVAVADDVDQDGVQDYFIYRNGLGLPGDARLLSGATGAVIYGFEGSMGDGLGISACGLGDVNGDGVPDFALGAPGFDTQAPQAGRVFVYSGADGSVLRTHDGTGQSAALGNDIARGGDVDGDGVDDLICGAPRESFGSSNGTGCVKVYSGATGSLLHSFYGSGHSWFWGSAVSAAGDVDGDGFDDVLVGSYTAGRVRVYSGRTGTILFEAIAGSGTSRLGEDVCTLGDVNGDGFDDFAASATNGGPASLNSPGLVRVYSGPAGAVLYDIFGSAGGTDDFGSALCAAGDWNGDGVQDLAIRGRNRVEIRSGADGALLQNLLEPYGFGIAGANSLAGPGDLDGDGLPDLLVGDFEWNHSATGEQDAGLVMLLSGRKAIGTSICTPAPSNFRKRIMRAQGSTRVADGNLVLSVFTLVPGSSGFLITSKGNGVLVRPGGSWGDLCIHDPGGMGRHYESLATSDLAGGFQFTVDLTAIPMPTGVTSVMVGETRYWQLWHRDVYTTHTGSNFSSAVGITFN